MEILPGITSGIGPYKLLDTEERKIRLLHLIPGAFDDDIHIRLEVVSLDDHPKYEALSYAWGTSLSLRSVLVNEYHYLIVTENLDCALRHLRYSSEYTRILWIDALCINQNDIAERNHQVQLMSHIYPRASDVVIWLGADSSNEYHRVLQCLTYRNAPTSTHDLLLLLEQTARFADLPWFSRVWVVQELVLSTKDPMVYVGRRRVQWSILAWAIFRLWLLLEEWDKTPVASITSFNVEKVRFQAFAYLFKLRIFHRLRGQSKNQLLYNRLRDTHNLRATDPRDKIYGILAITGLQRGSITPDYSMSVQQVFAQAATAMLQDNNIQIFLEYPLHFARVEDALGFNITPNRPSWLPDLAFWSKIPPEAISHAGRYWRPEHLVESDGFERGLPKRAFIQLSQDYKTLLTSGHIIGRISWASTAEPLRGLAGVRRLHGIYHCSAKHKGFTPRTFGQVAGDFFPKNEDPNALPIFEAVLRCSSQSIDEASRGYEKNLEDLISCASYRTFFTTDSGHLGRSYHPSDDGIVEGDLLVGLFGIDFPFILRQLEDEKYIMINVAYVVDYKWGYAGDATLYNEWRHCELPKTRVFEII